MNYSEATPGPILRAYLNPSLASFIYLYFMMLVYLITCAIVQHNFMSKSGFGDATQPRFSIEKYLGFDMDRPFVYRVLTPMTIRVVSAMIPDRLSDYIETVEQSEPNSRLAREIQEARATYNWKSDMTVERIVGHLVLYLNLLGVLCLLGVITRQAYSYSSMFTDFSPAVALLFLPMTFLYGSYIYDFPELFFALLCLVLLIKQKWVSYYVVFVLGCLNKETGVLVVIYFLSLYCYKLNKLSLCRHVVLHLALGGSVVLAIRTLFSGHPGGHVEFHFWDNLTYFRDPATWFSVNARYAPLIPVPSPFNVLNIFFFTLLIFWKWSEKPLWIRTMFIAIMAILIPLYVVYGHRGEIRVFYLAAPALYLLGIHTISTCANQEWPAKFKGKPTEV